MIDTIVQYLGQFGYERFLHHVLGGAQYDMHLEFVRLVAVPAGFGVGREILRYFAMQKEGDASRIVWGPVRVIENCVDDRNVLQ